MPKYHKPNKQNTKSKWSYERCLKREESENNPLVVERVLPS